MLISQALAMELNSSIIKEIPIRKDLKLGLLDLLISMFDTIMILFYSSYFLYLKHVEHNIYYCCINNIIRGATCYLNSMLQMLYMTPGMFGLINSPMHSLTFYFNYFRA